MLYSIFWNEMRQFGSQLYAMNSQTKSDMRNFLIANIISFNAWQPIGMNFKELRTLSWIVVVIFQVVSPLAFNLLYKLKTPINVNLMEMENDAKLFLALSEIVESYFENHLIKIWKTWVHIIHKFYKHTNNERKNVW